MTGRTRSRECGQRQRHRPSARADGDEPRWGVFLNVPPGDYVLTAHKAGMSFTPAAIRCRAGVLVNASPPWGLQAH